MKCAGRNLGDVGGDAPGLVAGEQMRRRATSIGETAVKKGPAVESRRDIMLKGSDQLGRPGSSSK